MYLLKISLKISADNLIEITDSNNMLESFTSQILPAQLRLRGNFRK